ncbi:MAG: type VII toxin-antitoxin system HepT family RNase toxin [Acidimicrobiales bacterium]
MVDLGRVRSKLASLGHYLDRLQVLAEENADAYVIDHSYEGRYLVQASAQTCIDLANHLIASQGWVPATEFRQAFSRLGEHSVLDADLVARMQSLAGLRNRLVHLYDDVDDLLVHAALQRGLSDLNEFATAFSRYLGPP